MHHDLVQLDQQVPAQRELQAHRLNDGRRASDDAARRCAGAIARAGDEWFTHSACYWRHPEPWQRSLTIVQRFYSGSGILIVAADQCQN